MKYVLTPAALCTLLACSTAPEAKGAFMWTPDREQEIAAENASRGATQGQSGSGGSPSMGGQVTSTGRAGSAGYAGSAGHAGVTASSAGTGGLGGSSDDSTAGIGGMGGTGGTGGAAGSSGAGGTAAVTFDPTQPFCKLTQSVDNYGDFWGCDMLDGWKPTTTAHSMIVWWIEYDKYGTPVRETSQGCQSNYYKDHLPCPVGMPCQLVLTYGPGPYSQLKYDGTCVTQ